MTSKIFHSGLGSNLVITEEKWVSQFKPSLSVKSDSAIVLEDMWCNESDFYTDLISLMWCIVNNIFYHVTWFV